MTTPEQYKMDASLTSEDDSVVATTPPTSPTSGWTGGAPSAATTTTAAARAGSVAAAAASGRSKRLGPTSWLVDDGQPSETDRLMAAEDSPGYHSSLHALVLGVWVFCRLRFFFTLPRRFHCVFSPVLTVAAIAIADGTSLATSMDLREKDVTKN